MQKSTNQGSSETIRETSSKQFNFNQYLLLGTPQHKPNPDIHFLEWLIGFFEAEGCFLKWPSKNPCIDRFGIEITQKDPKLMYKIRTRLGFGRVTVYTRTGTSSENNPLGIIQSEHVYARYYVHDVKNLERLIYLLNGNLVTEKKQNQFTSWLQAINKQRQNQSKYVYSLMNYQAQPLQRSFISNKVAALVPIFMETAWLSGFLEGDGGFWVSSKSVVKHKKDGTKYFAIQMKFYLTQEELFILKSIACCFGFNNTCINRLTNGNSSKHYNRFETCSLKTHLELIDYLNQFPFLGKRSIQLKRWSRLVNYRIYDYPVTPKSIQKVVRLIKGTKND